jgi:hypothetical protein
MYRKSLLSFGNVLTIIAVLVSSALVFADEQERLNSDFYTIKDIHITRSDNSPIEDFHTLALVSDCSQLTPPNEAFDPNANPEDQLAKIINIGKQVWQIVKENEATIEVRKASANALPRGVQCWDELESWSFPQATTYTVTYSNMLGMDVVHFEFQLIYSYGGTLNGKGAYISNLTVVPRAIDVMWGFDFNAEVQIPQVVNMGTRTDPIAGAALDIHWSVENVIKKTHRSLEFFVTGKGMVKEL